MKTKAEFYKSSIAKLHMTTLLKEGINARAIDIHMIKPIDKEAIIKTVEET